MYACTTPVAAMTTIARREGERGEAHQRREQQPAALPARRLRVAAGSANSRHAMPPTHTLADEDVQHVRREEHAGRALDARVAAERGRDRQVARRRAGSARAARAAACAAPRLPSPERACAERAIGRPARPSAGAADSSAPIASQSTARAPHTFPNRLSSVFSMIVAFSDVHSDTPAALAPCSRIPSTLTSTPTHAADVSSIRNRRVKHPCRELPFRRRARRPRPCQAATRQKEREAAEHQRDRQVVEARTTPKAMLGDLAGLRCARSAQRR